MPKLRLVSIPHPIGSLNFEDVQQKADNIIDDIISRFLE